MLDRATIDRIRSLDTEGLPVLSVYLGLRPESGTPDNVAARLKELLAPARHQVEALARPAAMSLRSDIEAVLAGADRVQAEPGPGVALIRCRGAGIDEYLSLPVRVRDRAIVDDHPYVRPLETTLEYVARTCAVVIDRRKASIFRFYMGRLETWEEMAEEEVRKANYGGFSGYEERRVRARAEEIVHRHYRESAARITQIARTEGFDLLLIGGSQVHVEGLRAVLPPDVAGLVAGTFTIDPHTMTPAIVQTHCEQLTAAHRSDDDRAAVTDILGTARAGGLAVAGLPGVLAAVNQRAVDSLLIQAGEVVPGTRCPDCAWLSTAEPGLCSACGEMTRAVPDFLDALAEAVRATGGSVRNVLAATDLAEHEIAARLRFSVPAST